MLKRSWIFTLIFVLTTHTLLIGLSNPIQAESTNSSIVNDVLLKDENGLEIDSELYPDHLVSKDSFIHVMYYLDLNDEVVTDAYTFQLPTELKIEFSQEGQIVTADRNRIGTFHVDSNGLITVSIDEEIDESITTALFEVHSRLNEEVVKDQEVIPLIFTLNNNNSKTIQIPLQKETIEENKISSEQKKEKSETNIEVKEKEQKENDKKTKKKQNQITNEQKQPKIEINDQDYYGLKTSENNMGIIQYSGTEPINY